MFRGMGARRRGPMMGSLACSVLLAVLLSGTAAAVEPPPFVNFESPQTQPIAISSDGLRLFVVNTPDNRVAVFDTDTRVRIAEVPVGLEPVGLAPRPGASEVWVVNHLSDTVDVIDTVRWRVDATIPVGDEPASILFTPGGRKAYVSLSQANGLAVIDATARAVARTISLDEPPSFHTQDPRAMALDRTGALLYVAPFESGNRTRGAAGDAGQLGTIVDDPTLSDTDLFVIRTEDDALVARVEGLGTILTGVAMSADNSLIYVTGWDARNRIRTIENLDGRTHVNTLAIVDRAALTTIDRIDLDAPLYRHATAVAQPSAVASDSPGRLWIAAQGSDAVVLLNRHGAQLDRLPVGMAPRGLALHPTRPLLYVYNRLSHDVTVIDTRDRKVLTTLSIGYDPTPPEVSEGRRFLFSAAHSGDGGQACAACHTDGHHDNVVWDLGSLADPKGPMFTQSLRGLADNAPFHWRGEKKTLLDFNVSFEDLFDGTRLTEEQNVRLARYLETIQYPPNPNSNRDGSFRSPLAECGSQLFRDVEPTACPPGHGNMLMSCVSCHSGPHGSNHTIVPAELLLTHADMEVAQLRGLFDKTAYVHDGRHPRIRHLLTAPPFPPMTLYQKAALEAFLLEFPTAEHHAAVGLERTINAGNCPEGRPDADVVETVAFLERQALLGRIDLTVAGTEAGGGKVHLQFDPERLRYDYDRLTGRQTTTAPALFDEACAGSEAGFTFTAWPLGTGVRARDRDLDALLNQVERGIGTDPADPDTDDDRLDDGDEVALGTEPLDPDTDGDSAPDGQEVLDGTDPTDAGSWLRWLAVSRVARTDVELVWSTRHGRRYSVLAFDGPRPPADRAEFSVRYTTARPESESPEGSESWVDTEAPPPPGSLRFYLVESLAPSR